MLALVLLEVGLRAGQAVPALRGVDTRTLFAEYPLELRDGFFTLRRNFHDTLWGVPFRTNEHGFRSAPVAPERSAPNELRIFLMGTCITLGEVDRTTDGYSIFADTIQQRLQARYPELKVRVVNAAIPGSFEFQDRIYYEKVIREFRPDLLILDNGSQQIVDPAAMLQEYRARKSGERLTERTSRGWGIRERLYDIFNRSVVISHFYNFRRNQEAVFRRYFYQRPTSREPSSTAFHRESTAAADYIREVIEPALVHYRADLSNLYARLVRDVPVVSYTFPHPLPLVGLEQFTPQGKKRLRQVNLMVNMPSSMTLDEVWPVFVHSYKRVEEINKAVAEEEGVRYMDLMSVPAMRDLQIYLADWFYTPRSSGSFRKGEVVAQFIMDNFEFSLEGSRVAVKEIGRD